MSLIADLVEADRLAANPYTELRCRLLAPEGGAVVQSPTSGDPKAIGAVGGDAASLSQGPGEQCLLQLLVSQQAAQGAPHPSLGGGDGGQAGVGRQGRPFRRPQQ